jgi:hypothetical protein
MELLLGKALSVGAGGTSYGWVSVLDTLGIPLRHQR